MKSANMQRLWPLIVLAAIAATLFPLTSAGDFALIADLENGTIYAGSMASRLADLTPLPLAEVTRPVAVDYDPVDKMVYWTDVGNAQVPAKISRAHLNGSNQVVLVGGTSLPDGLALDLVARVLYWTDGTLGHISRKPMDISGNEESFIDGLDKPRSLIIDHERSTLYWTDWGDNPRIERADLNGGNRSIIIEGGLTWPNGVSIDFEDDTLYWCDASTDLIEKSDLSGADRQLVVNITELVPLSHPFDLSLYKDYVYWTDWQFIALLRIHKDGRGEQAFGPLTFQRAGGIHIQEEPNYCERSPCEQGGTCLDMFDGFICYCPSGFHGLTCSLKVVGPCDSEPCLNGGSCMAFAETFNCSCPLGYQGTVCEIDPCDSTPCANDGSCSFSGQQFTCSCSPGYTGMTCLQDSGGPGTAVIVGASLGCIVIVLLIVGVIVYFVCYRIKTVDNSGRTVNVSTISNANETSSKLPSPKDIPKHTYQGRIGYDDSYGGYLSAIGGSNIKLELIGSDPNATYMEIAE